MERPGEKVGTWGPEGGVVLVQGTARRRAVATDRRGEVARR